MSNELLAAGALSALLVVLAALRFRRRRQPRLAAILAPPPQRAAPKAEALTPRRSHQGSQKPVELHAVGDCELVVIRRGEDEQRIPLGPGAISLGASPLCDVSVNHKDVRFVHAVIGRDGPQLRIHRFGPLTIDGQPLNGDESVLQAGSEIAVGDVVISVGQPGSTTNISVAA